MAVSRMRGILGRRPTIIKPFHRISSTFRMIACSKGFIDILSGVLTGMGWVYKIRKLRRINEVDSMIDDGVGHVVDEATAELLPSTTITTTTEED